MDADLPEPAARWVAEMLDRVPPAETHATCGSCALCPGGGDGRRPRSRVQFAADQKCCTDRPILPNFLVGGILAQGTEAGRASLRRRLAEDTVSPLGVGGAPGAPAAPSDRSGGCPHLLDGACSIYAHRNAGCATWFCRHERGLFGSRAWHALQAALRALEARLALWACREHGLPPISLQHLVAASETVPGLQSDGSAPDAQLWSGVADQEAFFVACHERVSALSWPEILDIVDPAVHALLDIARAAWDHLDRPLPDPLRPGIHQVVAVGEEGVLAETYTPLDPIALPSLLLAVLHHFDGRPTADVLDQLARDQGLALDPGFLRELVDFNVLSGVPPAT